MKRTVLLLIIILITAAGCANERLYLEGNIFETKTTDSSNDIPISGALVQWSVDGDDRNVKAYSDVNGYYSLEIIADKKVQSLNPGTGNTNDDLRDFATTLRVTKAGYKDYSQFLSVNFRYGGKETVYLEKSN